MVSDPLRPVNAYTVMGTPSLHGNESPRGIHITMVIGEHPTLILSLSSPFEIPQPQTHRWYITGCMRRRFRVGSALLGDIPSGIARQQAQTRFSLISGRLPRKSGALSRSIPDVTNR